LIRPVKAKKNFFFQTILPLALMGNKEITQQREAVENFLNIHEAGGALSLHQHEELIKIQRYYKVKGDVLHDPTTRQRLLKRIDIIPPALTLSQAANESGWGMSRFAQHANNIFGEWTFTPGTGLVPEGRPEGEIYEVRRFPDLYSSIRSYLRNLNTHSAYRSMRTRRLTMRQNGEPLTGYALAGEMRYYSTRRDSYVKEIREMIRGNRLDELNQITLLSEAKRPVTEVEDKKNGLMSSKEKASRPSKS
jgi:Bax protein